MITYRKYTDIQLITEHNHTSQNIKSLQNDLLAFAFGSPIKINVSATEKEITHWEAHLKDVEKELLKRGLFVHF
jgi:hypothetical protein